MRLRTIRFRDGVWEMSGSEECVGEGVVEVLEMYFERAV